MLPTFTKRHDWLTDITGLTLILCCFYFFWLGGYPLFTPDEGRYAEAAREMVVSHDYITPRVNGVAFLDKPILYYWLQAAALALFGTKEWAVRFFPALLGILGCLTTYICGRRLFSRRTGLIAAGILATSPLYFVGAHYANLDLEVAVWISSSLLFFITGVQESGRYKKYFLLTAYTCTAFACLTKGLIGLVFPCLIAGSWIVALWRFNLLKKIYLITGILLFISLVIPWYWLVQKANPIFFHYFFVTQHVTRFLAAATFNNVQPLWFYLPIVLLGMLPWTIFLVPALLNTGYWVRRAPRQHTIELFLLLWVGIILVFFSIPHSKIITYILPIFPALALLSGQYLTTYYQQYRYWIIILLATNILLLCTLTLFTAKFNDRSTKQLITDLKPILQPQDEVVNYFKFYQDVPFYLERRITLVANWQATDIMQKDNWVRELWFSLPFQDASAWLINETNFWQRWHSKNRLFVFLNNNYLAQFKAHAPTYFLLGQDHDILLVSNQPLTKDPKLAGDERKKWQYR